MDSLFLPTEVKDVLDNAYPSLPPDTILRSTGDLNGDAGEGYIIGYDDSLFLFSRKLGEQEFQQEHLPYSEIPSLRIEQQDFNSLLLIQTPQKYYTIRFSNYDKADAEALLNHLSSVSSESDINTSQMISDAEDANQEQISPPPLPKEHTLPASPFVGLAAALMYLSKVDDEIDPAEDLYIRQVCKNDKELLQAGLRYYKSHTFNEFLHDFAIHLTHTQALCYTANLLEIAMSDGVFHRCEQELIREFVNASVVTDTEYQAIREVLLIKNQTSALA